MNADQFDEFYGASAARLVGQLAAMLGSVVEAQDCVQEAFVKAWLHRHSFDSERNPEAWIRQTAWRTGISRWRQAKSVLRAYERRGPDPSVAPPGDDHLELMAALRQINPEQRRAIVLHHLCDLSVEEVAHETTSPVGTVKARLSRGRAALAEIIHSDTVAIIDGTSLGEAHHA